MVNSTHQTDRSNSTVRRDVSLRANGDTYSDRTNESALLTDRLLTSSASVTGIAGQRGTGKSSLALRVLANCAEKGVFTQVIHSPTSYEPTEFLVSIFQRVCEEVVARVDKKLLKQSGSLVERGRAERRRVLAFLSVLLLGAVTASAGAVAYWNNLTTIPTDGFPIRSDALFVVPLLLAAYVGSIAFLWILYRAAVRFYRTGKFRLEAGLRTLALELSERLKFQATRSVSAKAGVSFSKLVSGLSMDRSLVDRPLSIPGLTAELSRFLEKVAEVYAGRVVLCLDELDKIEDPDELDKLLRGIKGVLGHPSTHFILTVSEDALAKFMARRGSEKGIIESAFENIVFLDCVNLRTTENIVEHMHGKSELPAATGDTAVSTALLWMFGSGIPREIKRNVRDCLEGNLSPRTTRPREIWKLLFRSRLDSIRCWTLHAGGDNDSTYRFLVRLHESIELFDRGGEASYGQAWAKRFVTHWVTYMAELFSNGSQCRTSRLAFGRAAIEILLGASAVVYVKEESPPKLSDASTEELRRIFEFTRSNLQYARRLLQKYLTRIEVLDVDTTL